MKYTLLSASLLALLAATAFAASGPSCVPEGKPEVLLAATALAGDTLTVRVNPKQDLNVYIKPGASGHSSNTLVFKVGGASGTEVSRSLVGPAAGGNGATVQVSAPLLFDTMQIVPVSNTANPSLTVVQGR